jgi:hypothetical protein
MPKSIVLVTNTGESSELSRKSSKFDRNILQSFQEVLRFDSRPWSGEQESNRHLMKHWKNSLLLLFLLLTVGGRNRCARHCNTLDPTRFQSYISAINFREGLG